MKGYMMVFDNELPFAAELRIGRYKDSQKKPIYAGSNPSISVLDVQQEMGADHFSFVLSNEVIYSEIITQNYDLPKVFSTIGGDYQLHTEYEESSTPMMRSAIAMDEELPSTIELDLGWVAELAKGLYMFVIKMIEIPLSLLFILIV
uniref:Uncharacterized protein n=1 Tax=Strombidium inclinatum TaxID=197538 RepID=A0A7S3MVC4_9SPIT|mmetsp:Transcript_19362/g.29687  ORF Transcript_19362/g.29687 Transcript_19362/m.29687 type:complete len:147 (+) Transcript_19362:1091-1531(+)|eukprot:CAMPEP_0170492424 /NCGR_PEP_ID=MMETSP0208-20121228/12227_1 /TAXON_ID=197538 /ORGANISM="Strombidium inclinatum, Strain S3" /LENGTH=146 /DNA_ID=CAMNT_0010768159 /DNA_START=1075 /DNA_END=1515 /DNA_ORIENTATION=+